MIGGDLVGVQGSRCREYRVRKNIGKELNLVIWRIKTKSPTFHLANIICTRLTQNLAHQ